NLKILLVFLKLGYQVQLNHHMKGFAKLYIPVLMLDVKEAPFASMSQIQEMFYQSNHSSHSIHQRHLKSEQQYYYAFVPNLYENQYPYHLGKHYNQGSP